jgi:hypothetical protein
MFDDASTGLRLVDKAPNAYENSELVEYVRRRSSNTCRTRHGTNPCLRKGKLLSSRDRRQGDIGNSFSGNNAGRHRTGALRP